MEKFLELVKTERLKQINKHGYTHDHDDDYTDGSIADAAACYAANSNKLWEERKIYHKQFNYHKGGFEIKGTAIPLWKWNEVYFKKEEKSRKEQIITACALLMAEFERLERLDENNT